MAALCIRFLLVTLRRFPSAVNSNTDDGELKHGRQEQYNLLSVDFSLYLLFPFLPSKQQLHATERFACTQLVCHLRKASTQTVENTVLYSGLVGDREAPAKLTSYLRHCHPKGPPVTKLTSCQRHCLSVLQVHQSPS